MNNNMTFYSEYWAKGLIDPNIDFDNIKADDIETLIKLNRLKQGVGYFASIIAGRPIPVRFAGNTSYTEGETVTIGTSAMRSYQDLDYNCGLALHEGSHIKLTDFEFSMKVRICIFSLQTGNSGSSSSTKMSAIEQDLEKIISSSKSTLEDSEKVPPKISRMAALKWLKESIGFSLTHLKTWKIKREEIHKDDTTYNVNDSNLPESDCFVLSTEMHTLFNILEDRRIDLHVYKNAPGYRGYYKALYNFYFADKDITKAIESSDFRTPEWKSYIFRLTNYTNPSSDRNALPALGKLFDIMSPDFVSKLKSTKTVIKYATKMHLIITDSIINNSNPITKPKTLVLEDMEMDSNGQPQNQQDQGQGQGQPDPNGQPQASTQQPGGVPAEITESPDGRYTTVKLDPNGDGSLPADFDLGAYTKIIDKRKKPGVGQGKGQGGQGKPNGKNINDLIKQMMEEERYHTDKDSYDPSSDVQPDVFTDHNGKRLKPLPNSSKNGLARAMKKQDDYFKRDIPRKGKLADEVQKSLDELAQIKADLREVKFDDTDYYSSRRRKSSVKLYSMYLTSDKGMIAEHFLQRGYYDDYKVAFTKGLQRGLVLSHKLRIREEHNIEERIRLKSGKVDNRRLHEFGFDNFAIFKRQEVNTYNPVHIHLTVDFSGSMSGHKFRKCQYLAGLLITVSQQLESFDFTLSYRHDSYDLMLLNAYDSKDRKLQRLDLIKQLGPGGGTPEGLCYDPILERLVTEQRSGADTYFINISDGCPNGAGAIDYTASVVSDMKREGIGVLSYYVEQGGGVSSGARKVFTQMYGNKNSKFVDVENLNDVATTLNALLMQPV